MWKARGGVEKRRWGYVHSFEDEINASFFFVRNQPNRSEFCTGCFAVSVNLCRCSG